MIRKLLFVIFLLTGKLAFSQQNASAERAAFRFVDSVFRSSTVYFEINELRPTDSLLAVMVKFNNAMAENKEWFADYMNKYYVPGEGMPYNEKFGITKAEYDQIKNSNASSYKLTKIKSEKLTLVRVGSCISFQRNDSLPVLSYLVFCGGTKTVIFAGDTVSFQEELTVPSAAPFGQSHLYSWRYEKSNQSSEGTINIHQLSAKIIEIDLGTTIPGNRTFLRIKYQQIEAGENKANMDLVGFIN